MKSPGPSLSAPLFGSPFAVFSPTRLKSIAVLIFLISAFFVGNVFAQPNQQPVHQVPQQVKKLINNAEQITHRVSEQLMKSVNSLARKFHKKPISRPIRTPRTTNDAP